MFLERRAPWNQKKNKVTKAIHKPEQWDSVRMRHNVRSDKALYRTFFVRNSEQQALAVHCEAFVASSNSPTALTPLTSFDLSIISLDLF